MRQGFFLFILFTFSLNTMGSDDVLKIAEKYNKKKNQVFSLEVKKRKILAEIYQIEKNTEKVVQKKSEFDKKNVRLDFDLKAISKKIIDLEEKIKNMAPNLTERIGFVDQLAQTPWSYVFIHSQTVEELDDLYQIS
ncbi:MAG: hypothetical protein AAF203_00670, partial [Pseudomonadota bacterium]